MNPTVVAIFFFISVYTVVDGVSECYYCKNTCKDPLEKQTCADVLGGGVKSECYVSVFTEGEYTSEQRGCAAVKDDICGFDSKSSFSSGFGVGCSTCNKDLCNGPNSASILPISTFLLLIAAIVVNKFS